MFRRLAALDTATGARNTAFAVGTPNQPVTDIAVRSTGEVLITGSFTAVGGTARVRLANLDGTTGALGSLNVSINNTVNDMELDDAGNVVYVAGTFGTVGGSTRNRLAGISLAGPGSVTPLALAGITGNLSAVALDGNGGLYLGGSFQITPEKDNPAVIARVAIATSAVTTVVPYYETPRSLARPPVSGTSGALALVRSGSSLLVAGDFSDYGIDGAQRPGGLRPHDRRPALRLQPGPRRSGQHREGLGQRPVGLRRRRVPQHRRGGAQQDRQAGHRAPATTSPASPRPPTPTSRTWRSAPTAAPSTSAATSTRSTACRRSRLAAIDAATGRPGPASTCR